MEDKVKNLKKGRTVAFISVLISLALAIMKGIVGYLFNYQVLIADAIHSAADLMTHAASGFGLWIASRGKTTRFPYGLYRAETLACLVVGIFIFMAGIDLFKDGIHKLFHLGSVTSFPVFPIAASLISSIAGVIIAKMESSVGHAIGSQSLIASSKEAFLDIFTSLAVLVGILLVYYRIPYAEGVIIIIISLVLVKIGAENAWIALLILLDANLDPDLEEEIEEKIKNIRGVKGVGTVKIRQSGPFKMVECVIITRPLLSLYKAHEVTDKVEQMIAEEYEHIESIFIHVEPEKKKNLRALIPVTKNLGMDSVVDHHFARAAGYLVLKLKEEEAEIINFYENHFLKNKEHLGVKTSRSAIEYETDILFAASIGEISFHILKSNMIDVFKAEAGKSVKETIDDYYTKKLTRLEQPVHLIEESQISKMTPRRHH
ncbi:cation diffusion facilitator family transporter [Desulfocicer vacuolatum DSM 3385]|uniref:Cation diffusion facilitator family transporter n=1 Tax=Desulfocicer vacuolatum DSM 3385 TaxID=1121400 RepID=A0A1W2DXV2_9BACT|nr:cation diffusion facilitator family transporter [Desulfocicer vacuolatum]SMD01658.1 cation diffusion facilitator family transporter [Desulfocicer vacuolatum DSM 3385]